MRFPVNIHHWDHISFLHWPVDVSDVTGLLPDGLEVLTYEGSAWMGVTPFSIRVRLPGLKVPPGWASFPETNLRTYVVGPDGRQGLWFLRMEVAARWFVATLRTVGLPYVHRRMAVDVGDGQVAYTSHPLHACASGGHDIVVRPGEPLDPPQGGALERFLTARWGAYHRRGRLLYTPVQHPPWRLHAASVQSWDVAGLFDSIGLPAPEGQPVAHFSPGVTVKVGPPRLVR